MDDFQPSNFGGLGYGSWLGLGLRMGLGSRVSMVLTKVRVRLELVLKQTTSAPFLSLGRLAAAREFMGSQVNTNNKMFGVEKYYDKTS